MSGLASGFVWVVIARSVGTSTLDGIADDFTVNIIVT